MSITMEGSFTSLGTIFGDKNRRQTVFDLDQFQEDLRLMFAFDTHDEDELAKNLHTIDPLKLLKAVERFQDRLANMKLQNFVLKDFLLKNNPRLLDGFEARRFTGRYSTMYSAGSISGSTRYSVSAVSDRRSTRQSIGSIGSQLSDGAKEYAINEGTKLSMATKCVIEVQRRINDFENNSIQEIRDMKVQIEELKLSCVEIDKTARNFEVQFLRNVDDVNFLRTATERDLIRRLRKFVEEWVQRGESIASTLRLRINTMSTEYNQYRQEMIVKKDLKGILREVDFMQLKIKRDALAATLDDRISNLAGLKATAGHDSMQIAKMKATAMKMETECKNLSKKIEQLRKSNQRLVENNLEAEADNRKLTENLKKLEDEFSRYEAPSTQDYIEKKQKVETLDRENKVLKRKISLARMTLKNVMKRYMLTSLPADYESDTSEDINEVLGTVSNFQYV